MKVFFLFGETVIFFYVIICNRSFYISGVVCFNLCHEIIFICQAIRHHSDKLTVHSSFDEVLIDADVMQHCLYDPNVEIAPHEKQRFDRLVKEFGLSYIA